MSLSPNVFTESFRWGKSWLDHHRPVGCLDLSADSIIEVFQGLTTWSLTPLARSLSKCQVSNMDVAQTSFIMRDWQEVYVRAVTQSIFEDALSVAWRRRYGALITLQRHLLSSILESRRKWGIDTRALLIDTIREAILLLSLVLSFSSCPNCWPDDLYQCHINGSEL